MDFLRTIVENSEYAGLTAFILGIMTAISPCPLASNITAVSFIGRNLTDRRRVFISGIIYTLGRTVSYTLLAWAIYLGADRMNISGLFQGWGEKVLAPLLIIIGLFMLGIINIRMPAFARLSERMEKSEKMGYLTPFLLGIIFALAFCPYSGVLYFAILIPMTVAGSDGLYLPVVFAIATGLPVIIFAWLIAYTVGTVGNFYNRLKSFELWFRRIAAVIFIAAGIYYTVIVFFNR
jgi:cytochrome c biogenesis protein CcdA